MQFNSVDFMLFFPVVIAVYFIIPKKIRTIWLLVASYYFYMSWNAIYALLIGGSTMITYISGLLLSSYKTGNIKRKKRITMTACIVVNLGILALFKYANFAIGSVNVLLGVMKRSTIDYRLDLLLPVGISFHNSEQYID